MFDWDETGLLKKKCPNGTTVLVKKKQSGYKPMKDKLTPLLCNNANGDLKVIPLLVYHPGNQRTFKANNIMKSKLTVKWRSNSKAWLTR